MVSFINLPLDVIYDTLRNWIHLKPLALLDTSFCNHHDRLILLDDVFSRPYFWLRYSNYESETDLFISWIALRKLQLSDICLWSNSFYKGKFVHPKLKLDKVTRIQISNSSTLDNTELIYMINSCNVLGAFPSYNKQCCIDEVWLQIRCDIFQQISLMELPTIEVDKQYKLSGHSVQKIIDNCHNLVDFTARDHFKSDDLCKIIQQNRNLKKIDWNYNLEGNWAAFQAYNISVLDCLATNCSENICEVYFSGGYLSSHAIATLITACKQIKTVRYYEHNYDPFTYKNNGKTRHIHLDSVELAPTDEHSVQDSYTLFFQKVTNFNHIIFDACPGFSKELATTIVKHNHNVKKWQLWNMEILCYTRSEFHSLYDGVIPTKKNIIDTKLCVFGGEQIPEYEAEDYDELMQFQLLDDNMLDLLPTI